MSRYRRLIVASTYLPLCDGLIDVVFFGRAFVRKLMDTTTSASLAPRAMEWRNAMRVLHLFAAFFLWALAHPSIAQLASWTDGEAKRAVVAFVTEVTTPGASTFVTPGERIAVFDNDGTLWAEQPLYFQLMFVLDRIRAMAPQHPDVPVLVKLPQVDLVDNEAGKAIAIHKRIGRRPLAAFGNSDVDLQMLQWTTAGPGPRFALLVHHTDAKREWAYDRASRIGVLDKAWDEARARWTVVDMRHDWKSIFFAFE